MNIEINGYKVLNESPDKLYAGGPWYDKGLCNICKNKLKSISSIRMGILLGVKLCKKDVSHLPLRKQELKFVSPVQISALKTGLKDLELRNWLTKVLSVQGDGKDKGKVETALRLDAYNTRFHWALIRKHLSLESKRIGKNVQIEVKIAKRKGGEETYCKAHYDPTEGKMEVSICDDYMVADPVGILGAIHFEAHNARNGARFRQRDAWRDNKKPENWIPAVEYAGWTCAIELDTFFGWGREAVLICLNGGFIGVQEWRNLMSIGPAEYGCKDLQWLKPRYDYSADALYAFSFSSHNPNLADLSQTSFMGYLPGRIKHLNYDKFLGDLMVFQHKCTYKKLPYARRNALIKWLKDGHLKGWVEPAKADQKSKDQALEVLTYCRVIAKILAAEGNSPENIAQISRCRVPDALFDLCIKGHTKAFVHKVGGRELNRVRLLSTVAIEEFKAKHSLSDLDK